MRLKLESASLHSPPPPPRQTLGCQRRSESGGRLGRWTSCSSPVFSFHFLPPPPPPPRSRRAEPGCRPCACVTACLCVSAVTATAHRLAAPPPPTPPASSREAPYVRSHKVSGRPLTRLGSLDPAVRVCVNDFTPRRISYLDVTAPHPPLSPAPPGHVRVTEMAVTQALNMSAPSTRCFRIDGCRQAAPDIGRDSAARGRNF